jgi:hypothetical protein
VEYRHLEFFIAVCGRAELHARCRKASGGATASQPRNPSSRRRARCAALCTRPAPGDAHPGGSAFFEHACRILEQTADAAHRAQRAHRGQTRRVRAGFRFISQRGCVDSASVATAIAEGQRCEPGAPTSAGGLGGGTVRAAPAPASGYRSNVVSSAPSSATNTASSRAGLVALAFSLTEWAAPGGSSQLSPAYPEATDLRSRVDECC